MTSAGSPPLPENRNLLGSETSPYLHQHKDNPVHWRPWGDAAFAEAKVTGKPVLLSIGYAACHWCHVMAHESFENPKIAALMNELFVNIKVDREERPDIDQIYMGALHMMGEQGGWPLTIFLDADKRPFWGGTYFPPESRYGRPGFPDLLRELSRIYQKEPEKVAKTVSAFAEALKDMEASAPGEEISLDFVRKAATALLRSCDPLHGGIGTAPKFPHCSAYGLLWRGWWLSGETALRDAVLQALTTMSEGGLYDHLGGGYARYSVDAEWHVPHFEKMLYDNAQLIEALIPAWQATGQDLFKDRIQESCDWLLRDMRAEGLAFAGTLDADSEGVEGKYYVWTEREIDALLSPDHAALFKAAYDVTAMGNWEGKTILNRRRGLATGQSDEATLAELRKHLLSARQQRIAPARDDKILADWNGMAIAALAKAALVFDRADWAEAAKTAFDFLVTALADPAHGSDRLFHSYKDGQAQHIGLLDDYAHMARAALALSCLPMTTAADHQRYLSQAMGWVASAEQWFWDQDHHGFFLTASDGEALLVRPKAALDDSTPSGNGVMADVLASLWQLTGEEAFHHRLIQLLTSVSGQIGKNFFALASVLNVAHAVMNGAHVILLGEKDDPAYQSLKKAALSVPIPDLLFQHRETTDSLSHTHPAYGKTAIEGQATAYLCVGSLCLPPVTEAEALKLLLEQQAGLFEETK